MSFIVTWLWKRLVRVLRLCWIFTSKSSKSFVCNRQSVWSSGSLLCQESSNRVLWTDVVLYRTWCALSFVLGNTQTETLLTKKYTVCSPPVLSCSFNKTDHFMSSLFFDSFDKMQSFPQSEHMGTNTCKHDAISLTWNEYYRLIPCKFTSNIKMDMPLPWINLHNALT